MDAPPAHGQISVPDLPPGTATPIALFALGLDIARHSATTAAAPQESPKQQVVIFPAPLPEGCIALSLDLHSLKRRLIHNSRNRDHLPLAVGATDRPV